MKETSRELTKGGLMKEVIMKKREMLWRDTVLWETHIARVEDMKVFSVFFLFYYVNRLKRANCVTLEKKMEEW